MTDIAPPRAKRAPQRLTAGLFWLAAAGLALGSMVPVAFTRSFGDGYRIESAYWVTRTTSPSSGTVENTTLFGVPIVLAAVVLVVAALLAMLPARRWAAIVAGAFGAGILVD